MGLTDYGSQKIFFTYKHALDDDQWDQRLKDILDVGIYIGGGLTKVNDTTVTLATTTVEVTDGTHQVRIATTVTVNITVSTVNDYIILRWIRSAQVGWYADILAVATGSLQSNDIIFGRCIFTSSSVLSSFDYSQKTIPGSVNPYTKIHYLLDIITKGPYIDVRSYGVTGDGSTDDTTNIQTALTAAAGSTIIFPKPSVKYLISLPLNILSNTRVLGLGWPEIYQSAANNIIFNIPDNRENIEIAYFLLTGTGTFNATYAGRSAIDSNQVGGSSGVNDNLMIHHNVFKNISTSAISGTYKNGSQIYKNVIDLGTTAEHGIYVDGDDFWVKHNYILGPGNTVAVNTGIKFNDAHNLHIENNIIDNLTHSGILAGAATPKDVFIINNTIIKMLSTGTGQGIKLSVGSDYIVRGNKINNTKDVGFYSKVPSVLFEDNTIENSGSIAVHIDGAAAADISDTVVRDNKLKNNEVNDGIRITIPNTELIVEGNIIKAASNTSGGISLVSISNTEGIVRDNIVFGYTIPYNLGAYPQSNNAILGEVSTAVKNTTVGTMTGNETFILSDGDMFIKDPGGASRNFNPSGTFTKGSEITIINTADAAETITFDSAGLNAAIVQNNRGIFVYSGASWFKVFIG